MAFVVKIGKTLRNHWKKSVFFSVCGIYGAKYGSERYEEELLRREYCATARKYGNTSVKVDEKLKRVTVFLNPAGRNGKVRKLFEKNAAPLLHLAGFEVNIVKTEAQGQAKDFMSVIDSQDADVVVVAGGDGTVSEVITGLLRRTDQSFVDVTPVGVLPLGHTNSLARLLFTNHQNDVRWILDSTMAIIENRTKKIDVMSVTGEEGKTVYTVSHMQWGAYRDTDAKKSKFWIFGGLKDRVTYLIVSILQKWPPTLKGSLTYVLPCDGCSKCFKAPIKEDTPWKWWHIILPPVQKPVTKPSRDYSQVLNEECGVLHSRDVITTELSLLSSNYQPSSGSKSLALGLGPDNLSRTQFVTEGWRRIRADHPSIWSKDDEVLAVSEFSFTPEMGEDLTWFTNDSENYEAMPIQVKLLKDKLTVFCEDSQKPSVL